ncbi:MAG: membrane dipeptidase [Candidatus Hydrogenedentes bacterium]|nr:membrane dipeptidase [Candidatus Hydrogenedentota bacterium]
MKSGIAQKFLRWAVLPLTVLFMLFLVIMYTYVPGKVMRDMNRTLDPGPYTLSEAGAALHKELTVVDMHCDALLWSRDLAVRGSSGHVDLPRMREGNAALEFFTVVTRTPSGQNINANEDKNDMLIPLSFFQAWPASTWFSAHGRAIHQARRLHKLAETSGGKFMLIETREDVDRFLEARKQDPEVVAGMLGIEGLQCLENDFVNLNVLYNNGFRMMGFTHFFDNEVGGSAHGMEKGGITEFGKQVLQGMEERHIIVDLAHASPKLIDDILNLATRPVFVSHTGVRGVADNERNLSDEHLKRIAAGGGVIGIGFWETAVGEASVQGIVRAIKYTAGLVGADHVGLGSDYDGAVTAPFDISGVGQITDGLLAAGYGKDDIAKIMGGNVLRVLREQLPADVEAPARARQPGA